MTHIGVLLRLISGVNSGDLGIPFRIRPDWDARTKDDIFTCV